MKNRIQILLLFIFCNTSIYSQIRYVNFPFASDLINAINTANNGDTILFNFSTYPDTVSFNSSISITKKITIIGPANQVVVLEAYSDSTFSSSLFYIGNGGELKLENLTLIRKAGGVNNFGSSLLNNRDSLYIKNCLIKNVIDSSGQGGVLYNAWNTFCRIENSTITNNYASQGGAIYSTGDLEILSSTFHNNYAGNVGGGIFWHNNGGSFECSNSLFRNSTCFKYNRNINSLGYNMSNDLTFDFDTIGDCNGVGSLNLLPLQYNGGATQTYGLDSCSMAIDNGDPTISHADQRGMAVFNGRKDVGAFELQQIVPKPQFVVQNVSACQSFTWVNGLTYTSDISNVKFIYSGMATNGCDSVITLNLTIDTILNTISQNSSILMADQIGGVYQWLDCSNGYSVILGETNQSFNPNLSGNYAVDVSFGSCRDTSSCLNFQSVGILKLGSNDLNLNVFPNPSTGKIYIELPNSIKMGSPIFLFDSKGQLVMESKVDQTSFTLNLTSLKEGIYYVKVGTKVSKIILMHVD